MESRITSNGVWFWKLEYKVYTKKLKYKTDNIFDSMSKILSVLYFRYRIKNVIKQLNY